MSKKTPSIEEVQKRMQTYFENNPITKEQLDALAKAEEEAACKKCGRMIFCGDISKMCSEPDCGLKRNK